MESHGAKVLVGVFPVLLSVLATTPAAAQVTSLVNVDPGGNQGNNNSFHPSISVDGRYIAFYGSASNLVPGDVNATGDVFVRDLFTGATELVSVDSSEVQGNNGSAYPWSSADGRYVSFYSGASNLVAGDTNSRGDVFVRDRVGGTTVRASVDSGGAQGNDESDGNSISANGRFVSFRSLATNLVPGDTNGKSDIFVHDLVAGTTERVSVDSGGAQGNGDSFQPSISPGGRFVVFGSGSTNLVAADTNAKNDIFVRDRQLGTTARVSVDSGGAEADGHSSTCSISDDGRFVAFSCAATNLVPGDTNGVFDVFVRDRVGGTTVRVSLDSTGVQGNDESLGPVISFDGRHVAFVSSASNLVAGDANGKRDLFVRDRLTGMTDRISVDSGGVEANADCFGPTISRSGRFVAFWSLATNLVAGDVVGSADVFLRDRFPANLPTLCEPGVGGVIACPCGNPPSGAGRGCDNHGSATGGAAMTGSGVASLGWDTLVLGATGENSTALSTVWTGSSSMAPPGAVHAAGVRCVGGLKRLYSGSASGGVIVRPAGMDSTVSARSAAVGAAIGAGQTRYYFTIYRDPLAAGPCGNSASTVNLSNVLQALWSP